MAASPNDTYYRLNREKRLAYQHQWYARNKDRVKRSHELKVELDENWLAFREKRNAYYKEYYAKNRDRIRAQRAAIRARAKQVA